MTAIPPAAPKPDPRNWFVAQLRPNMRLIAERHLTRQGFDSFAPIRIETIRRRNRLKTEARPLFPGYLFVRFDPRVPSWQGINATRGIQRLISDTAHRPTPLPSDFMMGLLSRCDENGLLQTSEALAPGDRVRIFSGPFAGLVADIDNMDQQERLHLLIQVMGRPVRASLPADIVDRIPEPA